MLKEQSCKHCGKAFLPNKTWQLYCSRFCNNAAYYARRATPPDILNAPLTGPTAAQEADRERRKALPSEKATDPKTEEVLRKFEEMTKPKTPSFLDGWVKPDSE